MTRAATALLLVALAAGLSCSDTSGPPRPTSGTLRLNLTSPHTDDGALLLHLTGPSLTPAAVSATTGMQQYTRPAAAGGINVAVFGVVGAGPVLRIQVPNVDRAAEYHATIVEAASTSNALRPSLSGYAVQYVKD